MKIQKALLLLSLLASPLALANATEDLLQAIENSDINGVEKALAAGADLDTTRSGDNQSARSLAIAKILESAESQNTILLAGAAALSLPAMALYQKPKCAIAAILTSLAGLLMTQNSTNNIVDKLKTLRIDQLLTFGGGLGVVALAWQAPENWHMIVNGLGTAGLIAFLYQSYQLLKRLHIYG